MGFKKLIVFDFNLDWNKYDETDKKYKDLGLIHTLYFQAIKSQTVVVQSSGWFGDCLDFVEKTKMKDGYLIANAGAVIYDIAKKEILEANYMGKEEAKAMLHHGIMVNANMIIATIKHKYAYISNQVAYKRIEGDLYSPCEIIKDYKQLNELVEKEGIIDIAFITSFDTGKNEMQRLFQYNIERYFDNEVNDLIIKANQSSPFVHFSSAKSTKLKAVQKVMGYAYVEHLNDILYIACTCINRECYLYFKNTLISSNPDFLVEIANAKAPKYIADEINNLNLDFGLESDNFWK